jgi:hypothetical protein
VDPHAVVEIGEGLDVDFYFDALNIPMESANENSSTASSTVDDASSTDSEEGNGPSPPPKRVHQYNVV